MLEHSEIAAEGGFPDENSLPGFNRFVILNILLGLLSLFFTAPACLLVPNTGISDSLKQQYESSAGTPGGFASFMKRERGESFQSLD